MKKYFLFLIVIVVSFQFYACNGECMRCQKSGEPTLTYCENDFPSDHAYHDQIEGLDSLGYNCTKK